MSETKIQILILLALAVVFVIPVVLNLSGVKGVPMPA